MMIIHITYYIVHYLVKVFLSSGLALCTTVDLLQIIYDYDKSIQLYSIHT